MKKLIVALTASTVVVGMGLSAVPAFADDAAPADKAASSTEHKAAKSHHHHSKKSSKKSEEGNASAPK